MQTRLYNLYHLSPLGSRLSRLNLFFSPPSVIRKPFPAKRLGLRLPGPSVCGVMRGQTQEVEAEIFPSPAPSGKFNRVACYHKSLKGRRRREREKKLVPRKCHGGLNLSGMSGERKRKKKNNQKLTCNQAQANRLPHT